MKKNFMISLWFTLVTTVILGLLYPLAVTGLSQVFFHDHANGQLIERDGKIVGSRIIGQTFIAPGYFHSFCATAQAQEGGRVNVGIDYNYVRTNAPPGGCGCINLQGGDGWLSFNFTRHVGHSWTGQRATRFRYRWVGRGPDAHVIRGRATV